MFHIPCPVLVLVFLSLYILCVLSVFVIAIEILESFVATPAGIGGRRLYHLYYPFFVIHLHTIGLSIQGPLWHSVEATTRGVSC